MAWKARINKFLTDEILPNILMISEILGRKIAKHRLKRAQYEIPLRDCLIEIEGDVKCCLDWCVQNEVTITITLKQRLAEIISNASVLNSHILF